MKELRIGEIIKELRGAKGVSQETLAAVCDVSMQAVSKWENGQSCPDIAFLPLLADYFQVSIDYLLTGKESDPEQNIVSDEGCGAENAEDIQLAEQIKQMTKEDTLYIIQYRNGKILDKRMWEQDKRNMENENRFIPIAFEDEFHSYKNDLHMEVWGNASIKSGNVSLNLYAGGNVECCVVEGNVAVGGNMNCGDVEGDVSAGGSVTCGDIEGNVKAGNSVSCMNIAGDAKAVSIVYGK